MEYSLSRLDPATISALKAELAQPQAQSEFLSRLSQFLIGDKVSNAEKDLVFCVAAELSASGIIDQLPINALSMTINKADGEKASEFRSGLAARYRRELAEQELRREALEAAAHLKGVEESSNEPFLSDRLVAINRVSKTVKGGKRFYFAALVVVGDQRGRVGFGKGTAKEVPEAIRKATEQAKRKMIPVALKEGRTLRHDLEGRHGASRVVMRTAPPGTGIIAGGPMRAVFEMLGIKDVVAKSIGSQNPYNMIRATLDGLLKETSPRSMAQRRGQKTQDKAELVDEEQGIRWIEF